MINFEKFTNYSQEIIFSANAKKDYYKNTEVQPENSSTQGCNRLAVSSLAPVWALLQVF